MPRSLPDSEAAPKRLAIYCHRPAAGSVCVRPELALLYVLSASGILGVLTGTAAQWLAKSCWESRSLCCATIDGESAEVTNSLRAVDSDSVNCYVFVVH